MTPHGEKQERENEEKGSPRRWVPEGYRTTVDYLRDVRMIDVFTSSEHTWSDPARHYSGRRAQSPWRYRRAKRVRGARGDGGL